jgi:hypothetical protein
MVVHGATFDGFHYFSSSFSFAPGDSSTSVGHPTRKSSKAIKTLLDQIRQADIGDQSTDDPANFIESEPESDSNPLASSDDSEEEPIVPIRRVQRPAAKKKIKAKVVIDPGDVSDDDDGTDLLLRHLVITITYNFFRYRALLHHVRDIKST